VLLENAPRLGSAEQVGLIKVARNRKTNLHGGGAETRKWANTARASPTKSTCSLAKQKKKKDFEQLSQQIILSRKYT